MMTSQAEVGSCFSQVPKSEGPFGFVQGRLWGTHFRAGFCGEKLSGA